MSEKIMTYDQAIDSGFKFFRDENDFVNEIGHNSGFDLITHAQYSKALGVAMVFEVSKLHGLFAKFNGKNFVEVTESDFSKTEVLV